MGRDATPGAKVRFWVIEAGAETWVSREAVPKIKLVLTPIDTQARRGRAASHVKVLCSRKVAPGVLAYEAAEVVGWAGRHT